MADDNVVTKPFLLSAPIKAEGQTELILEIGKGSSPPTSATLELFANLKSSRTSALKELSSANGELGTVSEAVNAYLAVWAPLVPGLSTAPSQAAATPATSGQTPGDQAGPEAAPVVSPDPAAVSPDPAAPAVSPDPATPAASSPAAGPSLRHTLQFTWKHVLGSVGSTTVADVAYDIASVLQSYGLWCGTKAAALVQDARGAVSSEPALQAYKLLRTAAGVYAVLRSQLLPLLQRAAPGAASPASGDLDFELVCALEQSCLADAQDLSLLRAAAKGHAPGLVSGIAQDTAGLYAAAFWHLSNHVNKRTTGADSKVDASGHDLTAGQYDAVINWPAGYTRQLGCYLRYKYACCQAFTFAFAAMDQSRQSKVGLGVRLAQEGARLAGAAAGKLGAELDNAVGAAAPSGAAAKQKQAASAKARQAHDETVSSEAGKAEARLRKDNDSVYYQKVPVDIPEDALPAKKRLVDALPLTIPPPAPQVTPPALEGLAAGLAAGAFTGAAVAAAVAAAAVAGSAGGAATAPAADGAGAAAAANAAGVVAPGAVAVTIPPSAGQEGAQGGGAAAPGAGPSGGGAEQAAKEEFSCCRCLIIMLCMPILLLISAVGIVVWLLLLPFKCCCCCMPIGCLLQCIWDVFEWMVKAPVYGVMWISGSPWQPAQRPEGQGKA
mmetsp:Transcript_37629/g.83776  ORF Transcript_37629/g.83776 Transcript_37629/m.83776 type:complete len:666 (-) Transcript_37629:154-2151(-)|eukprot:CAMPEP_0202893108 /NCGR_PEP_ID=MMETSP1392-20130828/2733_1 /ASSEMBLY_ACC=CAM_ASM_000868 /TAXON_ID=225041 /ORGANISM="Chlamydomonas chlamydogama, Strain SAG 11-48b" /LENGTH=665 /DNA_ID=CAMNT_0049577311 /DNA_START=17 /DNA_END=2014 /DNA_ORIENTATION=-